MEIKFYKTSDDITNLLISDNKLYINFHNIKKIYFCDLIGDNIIIDGFENIYEIINENISIFTRWSNTNDSSIRLIINQ